MNNLSKILTVATKIRTPLSLSGLAIIVLYMIISRILDLNIFNNLGTEKTYLILVNILDKIFMLAVLVFILGILSFILTMFSNKKHTSKKSSVELLNSRNDNSMSNYETTVDKSGKEIIKLKQNDNY